MNRETRTLRGQSILEYAVLIGAVSLAMVGMNIYARRAMQANLSNTEDELNPAPNESSGSSDTGNDPVFHQMPGPHSEPVLRGDFSFVDGD